MAFALSSKLSTRSAVGATRRPNVAVKASPSSDQYLRSLPGITQPFPNVFDPAGLASNASVKDIQRWRESEITHGRVAMLAALGFVVQENVKDIPDFNPFGGHIVGPAIYHFQQIRQGFWEPLLVAIGLAESYRVAVGWAPPLDTESVGYLKPDYNPGELGFDPLGLAPKDPTEFKDLQSKELNNGRLAMIAVAGFVVQELVFQREFLELGDAPSVTPDQFQVPGSVKAVPGVPGGPPSPAVRVPGGGIPLRQ